jgi:hypothetical protein
VPEALELSSDVRDMRGAIAAEVVVVDEEEVHRIGGVGSSTPTAILLFVAAALTAGRVRKSPVARHVIVLWPSIRNRTWRGPELFR